MVVPGSLFGVIPLWIPVYLLAAIGFGLAGASLWRRFVMPVLLGRKDERRFDQPLTRLWGMILVVFGQRRVLQSVSFRWRDLAGIGHFIIFWSFVSAVFSYVLFIFLDSIWPPISGYILTPAGLKVLFWWMDILEVVALAAIVWAVVRRWIIKPRRLAGLHMKEAAIILGAIASLFTLAILTEATHVAAVRQGTIQHLVGVRSSEISTTTPVAGNLGRVFADAGMSFDVANTLSGIFWWGHYFVILGFGVYIAYSKHMHIVASPANAFFRSLKPRGALIPIPNLEEAESWGAKRPHEFSWKELLDGYACAVCGRCTDNCPANISGKPLSPMHLIGHVKENLLETAPALAKVKGKPEEMTKIEDEHPLLNGAMTTEWVWNCVTCGACEEVCPVMVEHIDSIMDMRRNLVMTEARMPVSAEQTLKSLETRGHPWRGTQATRLDWTKGLNVKVVADHADKDGAFEVLFWVGCTAALDQRTQSTARAMARVLDRAGILYAILGPEETCNGDPARRIGHEYLFKMLAEQNIQTLNQYKVKKIVTTCPHCFNTLKNEYPDFGGQYEVEHYTTFVKKLVDEGRIKLGKPLNTVLTYHDSCYLGRHNGVYDEPRQLIEAIPGVQLQEVPLRNRNLGYCCGAGGAHMWVEDNSGKRINHVRTEQVLGTEPKTVGVSCPFCLQMLQEGVESLGQKDKIRVADVIELVAESIEDEKPVPKPPG